MAPRRREGLVGPAKATRQHYEAQVVGTRHVPEAETLALEVGFHAEEPKPDVNDAVLAHLLAAERRVAGGAGGGARRR